MNKYGQKSATAPAHRPVMHGDTAIDEDGQMHTIVATALTITCTDGTTHVITLEKRSDGRWWTPTMNAG
jgi:hypothetical protein